MRVFWLRLRIRVAVWLHDVARAIEPDVAKWARVFPSYVLDDLAEQITIVVQLQGVDDHYRVRRVLKQIKQRYPSVPDGDIIVYTLDALTAIERRTPAPDPAAADAYALPAPLRRRRV